MRRIAILTARLLLMAALVAAVADIHLPGSTRARHRLHLIDVSGSVLVRGPSETLRPADARRVVEWDRTLKEPGDAVTWAAFGADLAFESETVDAEATDLEGALEKALARDPTEIVVHTDGRADPGRALLLCRERSVPVHAFPLGPPSVRDARIARVRAPAEAAAGESAEVEVTIESTFDTSVRLRMDDVVRDIQVGPGAPALVSLPRQGPGPFTIALEIDDACPQNNRAAGRIAVRSEKPRVLFLSQSAPALSDYAVQPAATFRDPAPFAAVVLDNVRLAAPQQKRLADYVRGLGGGLILLGGLDSYLLGGWKGTAIEALSPLRATPDHRVAVVFAIDASGSMGQPPEKIRDVLTAVRNAWSVFGEQDSVAALHLPGRERNGEWSPVFITDPERLRDIRAQGPTVVREAMDEARRHLEQQEAGRKHLVILTDGETAESETPEERIEAARRLEASRIGLTVVTTNRELEVGRHLHIGNWSGLDRELRLLHPVLREVQKKNPGPLDLADHEVTRGVPRVVLPWMNLTSARQAVELLGTVGRAPAVYPALAFHSAGRGRVGAFAFKLEDVPSRLLTQAIRYVAGDTSGGLELTLDYPIVRARGKGPPRIEATYLAHPSGESGTVALDQVRSDVWEGALPPTAPGTVSVRLQRGGAAASATIPSAAEYGQLGVDVGMLHRIAEESGGRVLRSLEELAALPRPERAEDVSGRPTFILTALFLIFVELALTTFWKEKKAPAFRLPSGPGAA